MSDWSADPDGFNESVIREFRASGGVVGGELAHLHLLLLTTTDVRRGRRRTTPLAYHRRGERYVVIASNGGATTHPKWFRNLERDPNVTVEVGAERFPATARILDGAERDAVFAAIVARAPAAGADPGRSEEHTSELQSRVDLVCRLLLEKKKPVGAALVQKARGAVARPGGRGWQ